MGFGIGATRTSRPRRKPAIIAANSRAGSMTFDWTKSVVKATCFCVRSIVRLTSSTLSRASTAVSLTSARSSLISLLMIASDSEKCMVAGERRAETAVNCSAISFPCTAICLPCSLIAVTRSSSGSIFSSIRFTDFTARLTNIAIAIIAIAITINEAAIITMIQNSGSRVLIWRSAGRYISENYLVVRFVTVVGSSIDAARHLGLSFLFLVRLLARVDGRAQRSTLACGCVASRLGHIADSLRRLRIKLSRATTRRFIILAGAVAQLLGRLTRTIDSLSGGVRDVAAQFLARLRRE